MRRLFVLLPAYNEELSLVPLVEKLMAAGDDLKQDLRMIVGNDGSRDRTGEIAEELSGRYPLEVIHHKINRGLGETVRDLFERAAELADDEDVIVRMDCDDTHEPKFMQSMIERLDQGYDVVIASRFKPGGGQRGVSPYRAFISRGANLFMKIFFPIKGLQEYTCGYRAYRASIIRRAIAFYGNDFIQLKGLGFTCTLEKLVKLKILGARFAEVPFVLRYDLKESASKMVGSLTMLGYIVMAVLYHWPWGGWRLGYREKLANHEARR